MSERTFLFTTQEAVVNKAIAFIDAHCGYPNRATKTDHAVAPIKHSDKEWWLVPIPDDVWSPRLAKAVALRDALPGSRKADAVIDTVAEAQTKLTELRAAGVKLSDPDFFAVVSEKVATAAGFFPDSTVGDVKAPDVIK